MPVYLREIPYLPKIWIWLMLKERRLWYAYVKSMSSHHRFSVSDCGCFLNSKWPHIGASLDGVTNRECCGKEVVEIRCPYYHLGDGIICSKGQNNLLKKGFWWWFGLCTCILFRSAWVMFNTATLKFTRFQRNKMKQTFKLNVWFQINSFGQHACREKLLEFFNTCVLP